MTRFLAMLAVALLPLAVVADAAEDRAEVLALNTAFYDAFRNSDMAKMSEIWGRQEPIIVQHPSTQEIIGREQVLASWQIMMRRPPDIYCALETIRQQGRDWGVICNEQLNPGSVRMINVFRQENGAWKMIYHGPAPREALNS